MRKINLRKAVPFRTLNQIANFQESIETCDSLLNNPAEFYGDDEEWHQVEKEKDFCEKCQNKILKSLGFNRVQEIVDRYRNANAEDDCETMDYLLPILDACGVRFGMNTAL